MIEKNKQGELKYRDEKGNEYPVIESRTSLSEIETQDSLKKRNGNIISSREEGRTTKIRTINKSYQTSNEEEQKGEEEHKES